MLFYKKKRSWSYDKNTVRLPRKYHKEKLKVLVPQWFFCFEWLNLHTIYTLCA